MIPSSFVRPLGATLVALLVALPVDGQASGDWPPPSPYRILGVGTEGPPRLDVISACGSGLLGEGTSAALADAIAKVRQDGTFSAAVERLTQAGWESAPPRARACAELELARIRLNAGYLPEARTHALRAGRALEGTDAPPALLRAARFYRAESSLLSDDPETARVLYAGLASGGSPAARASQLRLADLDHAAARDDESRAELERLLETAGDRETRHSAWGARIAERILRDDPARALAWIERAAEAAEQADRGGADAAAIAVRRADLLYRTSEPLAGREILRSLADGGRHPEIRQLAVVRLIDLERRRDAASHRQLERVAASAGPSLRAYASGLIARHDLMHARHDHALDVLVRGVHDGAPADLVPGRVALFDEALAGLVAGAECDALLVAIGGRRDLLMRNASTPTPFLRLGDCQMEIGLAASALDTYRGITRAFGPEAVGAVTLRIARAQLRTGQLAPARAAARGAVKGQVEPVGEWRLLYGRILLAEDRPGEAASVLAPVIAALRRDPDAVGSEGERALLAAAQAAVRSDAGPGPAAALRAALEHSAAATSPDPERRSHWAEAVLLAADLLRSNGLIDGARDLYAQAFINLEPGSQRSRAGYWQGLLTRDPSQARDLWSSLADQGDPWARLADSEIGLSRGRQALGSARATRRSRFGIDAEEGLDTTEDEEPDETGNAARGKSQ